VARPDRIILFGSPAAGDTKDSDFDLLVVEPIAYPANQYGRVIYEALAPDAATLTQKLAQRVSALAEP
jgi:predicted nucleotidyltransferase